MLHVAVLVQFALATLLHIPLHAVLHAAPPKNSTKIFVHDHLAEVDEPLVQRLEDPMLKRARGDDAVVGLTWRVTPSISFV